MNPDDPQQLGLAEPASAGFGDHWKGWLQDPSNRTALMQAGLALMQPIGVGQTFGGHVADAAGQGLEARDRSKAAELDAEKTEAETARATASAARAEEGMNISRERLEISKSKEGRLASGKGGKNSLFKSPAHRQQKILDKLASLAKAEADNSILSGKSVSQAELLSDPEWRARNQSTAESMVASNDSDPSATPAAGGTPTAPAASQAPFKYPKGATGTLPDGRKVISDGTKWVTQ